MALVFCNTEKLSCLLSFFFIQLHTMGKYRFIVMQTATLIVYMSDSNTYNDNVPFWTAHMDADTEEPAIKIEPDGFEPLVQEHPECRFGSQNAISLKRKREQDDMDQVYPDNEDQYLDYPVKGGDVDEFHVKGEPATMKQLDVVVQQSLTTQGTVQLGEPFERCIHSTMPCRNCTRCH